MATKKYVSAISALHYFKLVFRSVLLIAMIVLYIIGKVNLDGTDIIGGLFSSDKDAVKAVLDEIHITNIIYLFLGAIYALFLFGMILRFFPSGLESMGCQKQFKINYEPTGVPFQKKSTWRSTLAIFLAWIALNGAIGILYFVFHLDVAILFMISIAYSICDMICILFFCPFQTWFMKNKCCGTCRIYNWDYAMMFTPMIFVPGPFTYTILGASLLLLLVWEIAHLRHPERFSEQSNACLSCRNCPEKLCQHKKQLRGFLKKNRKNLYLSGNTVVAKQPEEEKVKETVNQ